MCWLAGSTVKVWAGPAVGTSDPGLNSRRRRCAAGREPRPGRLRRWCTTAMPCALVRSITHLRSYEQVIRLSGDEFICTISDATIESVRERFGQITQQLNITPDDGSITVGFAQLVQGDSPMDLIDRADSDLIAARNTQRPARKART